MRKSWTQTPDLEKRIQGAEMRCPRNVLGITYKDHVEEVRNRIKQATGPHEDLLANVKKRKMKWYDHDSRLSGLAKKLCKTQFKEAEKEAGRRKDGKTTSENGQASQ